MVRLFQRQDSTESSTTSSQSGSQRRVVWGEEHTLEYRPESGDSVQKMEMQWRKSERDRRRSKSPRRREKQDDTESSKNVADSGVDLKNIRAMVSAQAPMSDELRRFGSMVDVQAQFRNDWGECMLTLQKIQEPVRAGDGNVYERWAIEKWLASNNNCSPLTMCRISPELTPLTGNAGHVAAPPEIDHAAFLQGVGAPQAHLLNPQMLPQQGHVHQPALQHPHSVSLPDAPSSRHGGSFNREDLQRMLDQEAPVAQMEQMHLQRETPNGSVRGGRPAPLQRESSQDSQGSASLRSPQPLKYGPLGDSFEISALSTAMQDPEVYKRLSNTPAFGTYATEQAKEEEKRRSLGFMSLFKHLFHREGEEAEAGSSAAATTKHEAVTSHWHAPPPQPGPISLLRNLIMPTVDEAAPARAAQHEVVPVGPGPLSQMRNLFEGVMGECRSDVARDSAQWVNGRLVADGSRGRADGYADRQKNTPQPVYGAPHCQLSRTGNPGPTPSFQVGGYPPQAAQRHGELEPGPNNQYVPVPSGGCHPWPMVKERSDAGGMLPSKQHYLF
eukprot:CAMPEP_0181331360 /NCGR_PEP_ID=MMETSP1101-20121128/24454_1 /TAXON_ID=46948 /ORGANISM="Rhodomonas abbreviata, Strain Caron Lab Isolate" /LENGTH=555 /DNA_ID=CAMNT_0023440803 /DNA_START=44 /DNA_END=1711 /DNA_ORIENTATION=-